MKATDIKVALVDTVNPTPTSVKMTFSLELDNVTPGHAAPIADLSKKIPQLITDVTEKNLFGMVADGSAIANDITQLTK